jgi:hypothetical protein
MPLKKTIVPESDLPPVTVFEEGFGYLVRYRVVSEDGNRTSHYSPNIRVLANYLFERPQGRSIVDFGIVRAGPIITIAWDPIFVRNKFSNSVIKKEKLYDLWIRWSKGESSATWILADPLEGSQQGFFIPSSYTLTDGSAISEEPNTLSVKIFVRSTNPSLNNSDLLVYEKIDENIAPPTPPPST